MCGARTRKYSGRDRRPVCGETRAASENVPRVTLCRIEDLSDIEHILRLSPEAGAWSAQALTDALRQHPAHFLVARQEKEFAGFILGRRVLDEGEILNLAVRPELRKRGVAKALVRTLLEIFLREDVTQVFLEVRESNRGATAFYKDIGFRQTGLRAGYYQNPVEAALVLALKTASPEGTSGAA